MATPNIFKVPSFGSTIGIAGDIYSGITAFNVSKSLAADLRFEGGLLYGESQRTANIILAEGRKFAAGQSLQYLASGVQVAGSALVTIAQTKKYAETEATGVRERGAAQAALAEKKARRTIDEGRASLVSGIFSGVSKLFL